MTAMPFGLHMGKEITDIPRSYLNFLLEQDWFEEKFPDLFNEIEEELEIRTRSYIDF